MLQSLIVFQKIGVLFLVMLVGWWSARRGWLVASAIKAMSLLVVQVSFPCMVFVQMLGTVSLANLHRGWWVPLFALASMGVAALLGRGLIPLFRIKQNRRTFVFLVMVPNWVFLPLPIAEGLYGAEGVRFVLLYNLGAQIVLWTLGVWILRGSRTGERVWQTLLGNAGIWATLGGALLALTWPGASRLGHSGSQGLAWLLADGFISAMKMVGDLTIPLSLLTIGAQLASLGPVAHFEWRSLVGIVAGRLVAAPLVTMLLIKGVMLGTGVALQPSDCVTAVIIVAMPVALSCTLFAERFGGDSEMSSASIFATTLLSLLTVPLLVLATYALL